MNNETQKTAEELVNAIKENLLKPMYHGINNNTNQRANELKSELAEKIKNLESKVVEIKTQQDAFIEALRNVKWDE